LDVIDLGVQSRKIKGRDKNLCLLVGVGIGCAAVGIFASGIYAYVFYKDKQEAMDLLQGRYDLLLMQLDQFNELKSKLDQVKGQIDKQSQLEAAVTELNEESKKLRQQCLSDEQIEDLEALRKRAEEKNEELRRRREEESEQYNKATAELELIQKKHDELLKEKDALKKEADTGVSKISELKEEISRLETQCKNFKKVIENRPPADQELEAQLKYQKEELELLNPYREKLNNLNNKSNELYGSMIDITNKYRKNQSKIKSGCDIVRIAVNQNA
jgi:chromosome segregation ATPase